MGKVRFEIDSAAAPQYHARVRGGLGRVMAVCADARGRQILE
jgi:hypothetical protein